MKKHDFVRGSLRARNPMAVHPLLFPATTKSYSRSLRDPSSMYRTSPPTGLVLTPDITIGEGMTPLLRACAVVLSRMAGVVWQSHVLAVASYGSRRDVRLRSEFERGLSAMVERLPPR